MKCQYCGSDLKPGGQFCEQCGGQVSPDTGSSPIYPPANPVPPAQFAPPPSFTPTPPPPVNPPAYVPNNPPVYTPPPAQPASGTNSADIFAIVSLVLGIISLCASFGGWCGLPFPVLGGIFGFLGLNSRNRTFAIIGLVLSGISILLILGWAIFGPILLGLLSNYSG